MPTLSMPSAPGFTFSSFGLRANTQIFESPLSRVVQTVELSGAIWEASYTLPAMAFNSDDADNWHSFLLQCQGMAGRLYFYDPDRRTPRGTATGTPLVKGASQTGRTLLTDGWTAGVTGIMKAGDYFQIGVFLHRLVSTCNSNGSGEATLTFEPPLRSSPSDNAPITVTNCVAIGMLAGDDQAMWGAGVRRNEPMTFSVREVL